MTSRTNKANKANKTKPEPGAARASRIKRPELPRTEPVRSWGGIFGAPTNGAPARATPEPPPPAGAPSVQRGVELGYRVIDEYIKQGAAVAKAFGGPRRGAAPSGEDLPKMTQRMMQYASDFTALWFDAMTMMMQTAEQQAAKNGHAPAADTQVRVVVELRTARPVDVIVSCDQPLTGPVVLEPPPTAAATSKLIDMAIAPQSEPGAPLKLRVRVGNRAAPGRYTRALLDAATGHPSGRVTVTVEP